MGIFNITQLTIPNNFYDWYLKTNEIVTALNTVEVVDVIGAMSAGIRVAANSGGVIALAVKAGAGLGFDNDGNLTIGANNPLFSTAEKARTGLSDKILVIDSTTGVAMYVPASGMLPTTFPSDQTFSGDVTFLGEVTFASNAFSVQTTNSGFTDNLLELSVKFDDYLVFATIGSGFVIGEEVYLVDKNTVGDDFSGLNTVVPSTFIGYGELSAIGATIGKIQISNFVFSSAGDSWSNYTDPGATIGGDIRLIDPDTGATAGGLIDQTPVKAAQEYQTSPLNADNSGLSVTTSDGDKLFVWRYNGATEASAWTSYDNFEVVEGRSLYVTDIRSGTPDSSPGVINMIGSSGGIIKFELRFKEDGDTDHFFLSLREDGSADALAFGYKSTAGTTTAFVIEENGAVIANAASIRATNWNADLLDGAHGSTNASSGVIPIALSDGTIDPDFLPGGGYALTERITQASHGLSAGNIVRKNSSGNFTKAQANSSQNAEAVGIVKEVHSTSSFTVCYFGVISSAAFGGVYSSLVSGSPYFLDADIAGGISSGIPDDVGEVAKPVLIAMGANRIFVTNFVGQNIYPATDSLYARSLVPVGSIYFSATDDETDLGILRGDFLRCDGKMYSVLEYPDLHEAIQGRHHVPCVWASTGGGRIVVAGPGDRNLTVGKTIRLTYKTTSGASFSDVITIASSTTTATGVTLSYTGSLSGTPSTTITHKLFGSGDHFLVPDLQGRLAIGIGNPDSTGLIEPNIANVSLGQYGNFGSSTGASASNIADSPYIGLTPVIRARKETAAIIIDGHVHDDRYVSFLTNQTGDFTLNQKITAINNLTGDEELIIKTYSDQNLSVDQKRQAQRNMGIRISPENESPTGSGEIDMDLLLEQAGITLTQALQYFVRYDASQTVATADKIRFANNAGVLSLLQTSNQIISGPLFIQSNTEITNGATLRFRHGSGETGVFEVSSVTGSSVVQINAPGDPIIRISPATQGNKVAILMGSGTQRFYIRGLREPLQATDATPKDWVEEQITASLSNIAASYLNKIQTGAQTVQGSVSFVRDISAQHSDISITINSVSGNIWSKFTDPLISDQNSNRVVRARDTFYHEKLFKDDTVSPRVAHLQDNNRFNSGQLYQHTYQSGPGYSNALHCQGFIQNGAASGVLDNPFRLTIMETPFVPHRARIKFTTKLEILRYGQPYNPDQIMTTSSNSYQLATGDYASFDFDIYRSPSAMPSQSDSARTIFTPLTINPNDPFVDTGDALRTYIGAVSHSGWAWGPQIVGGGTTQNWYDATGMLPVLGRHNPYGSGNTNAKVGAANQKILCDYNAARNLYTTGSAPSNPVTMAGRGDNTYSKYDYWDWQSQPFALTGITNTVIYFFAKFWTGTEGTNYYSARNNSTIRTATTPPFGVSFWGLAYSTSGSANNPYNTSSSVSNVASTNSSTPVGIVTLQSPTAAQTGEDSCYMTATIEGHATGPQRHLAAITTRIPDLNPL